MFTCLNVAITSRCESFLDPSQDKCFYFIFKILSDNILVNHSSPNRITERIVNKCIISTIRTKSFLFFIMYFIIDNFIT